MARAIEISINLFSWIAIVLNPTLILSVVAFFIYAKTHNATISIITICIGFVIGVIISTTISIKFGATECLSRVPRIS